MAVSSEKCLALCNSPWKILITQIVMFLLIIWPLTPDFPTTGRYAYYSEPPFVWIFFVVNPFLGVLWLGSLWPLWRSLRGLPAIEITDDMVILYAIPRMLIARSTIEGITPPKRGLAKIRVTGKWPRSVAVWWLKDHQAAWKRLEALLGPSD